MTERESHPRPSNWDRFRAVYERILTKDPEQRAMYDSAVEHFKAEARRLRGDDDGETAGA